MDAEPSYFISKVSTETVTSSLTNNETPIIVTTSVQLTNHEKEDSTETTTKWSDYLDRKH